MLKWTCISSESRRYWIITKRSQGVLTTGRAGHTTHFHRNTDRSDVLQIYSCYYINSTVLVIMFFQILKSLSLMNCNHKLLQFSKQVTEYWDIQILPFSISICSSYTEESVKKQTPKPHLYFICLSLFCWHAQLGTLYMWKEGQCRLHTCICICEMHRGARNVQKGAVLSSQGTKTWLPPANLPPIPVHTLPSHCQILQGNQGFQFLLILEAADGI